MTNRRNLAIALAMLALLVAATGCLSDTANEADETDGTDAPRQGDDLEEGSTDGPPDDGTERSSPADGNASDREVGPWTLKDQANATLPNNAGAGACSLFEFRAPADTSELDVTVQAPTVDTDEPSAGTTNLTLVSPEGTSVPMGGAETVPDGVYAASVSPAPGGAWTVEADPYVASLQHEWSATVEASGTGPAPLAGLNLERVGC